MSQSNVDQFKIRVVIQVRFGLKTGQPMFLLFNIISLEMKIQIEFGFVEFRFFLLVAMGGGI